MYVFLNFQMSDSPFASTAILLEPNLCLSYDVYAVQCDKSRVHRIR